MNISSTLTSPPQTLFPQTANKFVTPDIIKIPSTAYTAADHCSRLKNKYADLFIQAAHLCSDNNRIVLVNIKTNW